MIGRLSGLLAEKTPPTILVDCHGVGYEMQVSMSTFYNLPALGEPVTLLTQLVVREDAHLLFGFATTPERHAFRELVKVSGVGPRTALAVLSGMSVDELSEAVATQQISGLVKVPGIGKKTAERLLLELEGKLANALPTAGTNINDGERVDIQQALLALGYSDKEAAAALKALPGGVGVAEGIKLALKMLAK